ncbi:TetR/AcrR family transcriptional regulator [Reichenbachiella sp. MALMAid0571]|uniref:TetR/AcrR family transcriptional regulator n=1 Tax=Reichenbachiella sp. MALMAid0571 TaxID=3143939 RepID=UPI0032DFB8E1
MKDTRTDIVNLAEKLIRTRGYNGFSYKDISAPLNIKNAAVHYYFPTKCDLGLAVVNRNRNAFEIETRKWSKESPDVQLSRFMKIYEDSRAAKMVCFMGAFGSSYDSLPSELQGALTIAGAEIRLWLKQLLTKGLEENVFAFTENIECKADSIISALLASLILGKVTGQDILANVRNVINNTI